jgi:hypothetical protein
MTLAKKIARFGLVLAGVGVVALFAAVIMTAITPARSIGMQQVIAADPGHQPLAQIGSFSLR